MPIANNNYITRVRFHISYKIFAISNSIYLSLLKKKINIFVDCRFLQLYYVFEVPFRYNNRVKMGSFYGLLHESNY